MRDRSILFDLCIYFIYNDLAFKLVNYSEVKI